MTCVTSRSDVRDGASFIIA